MHTDQLRIAAEQSGWATRARKNGPRRGEEIFQGTDYPRTWDEFIGQTGAIVRLKAACYSSSLYGRRLEHILLATGLHGIGKTALAKLIAANINAGLVEVSGKISVNEIRPVLRSMADGDVLFIDEIHQLVTGGKSNAEWLLHLLQDGVLMTANGPEPMPNITVVGATTDVQKLPQTIISRFQITPTLTPYTEDEAATIAAGMAVKVGFGELIPLPTDLTLHAVAKACNNSPRDMKSLLIALRDAAVNGLAFPDVDGNYDMTVPLEWQGLTEDGLDAIAQNFLCVLLVKGGLLALDNITKQLGEPGPVHHTEKLLLQKGLIEIVPRGRQLTDRGSERASQLLAVKLTEEAA